MNLKKMSLREQILTFATVAVLILGSYTLFRFYPASKEILRLNTERDVMEKAVKTGAIPDAPFDDVKSLQKELDALTKQLEATQIMANEVEKRLSGPDTTAARIAISDIARQAMVRISVNEEFKVTAPISAAGVPITQSRGKNVSSSDIARRNRNARAAAARQLRANPGFRNTPAITTATVNANQVTPLVASMGVGAPMERPMQRLTMEGTFDGITKFIRGLEEMNEMATVVQFQLGIVPQSPPPGYNQRLSATLVIAL